MLENLKIEVCNANLRLVESGLVILTWGNVSSIDREKGLVVIKPSGVSYHKLIPEMMVVIDLKTGEKVEGSLKPSSDTPTHLELYRSFTGIGSVVHTHSTFATVWAQACNSIPALGTTHADTFFGSVPCTRPLTKEETTKDYENNTGRVIVETFFEFNPLHIPGVLVANHGPFTWGTTSDKAVENAIVLEEVARMAFYTSMLTIKTPIQSYLIEKHFLRKHGTEAYYGQK
jgi:L-ribulose-5-phosphate 4-epimerase